MTRSRLITREARVEHTVELGCTIAGIFDFLRLCGNGIVDRLLDRNRTERSVRSRLRALAGASESQPIFVRHTQTSAWIEIDPKGSVAARRQKPERLPSIDLGQAVTREPALGDAVYAASTETRALRRAWKLMEPLVHGWGLPSRQQFGRLIEWSPVLEHLAYRCATRMSSLFVRASRRSQPVRRDPRPLGQHAKRHDARDLRDGSAARPDALCHARRHLRRRERGVPASITMAPGSPQRRMAMTASAAA